MYFYHESKQEQLELDSERLLKDNRSHNKYFNHLNERIKIVIDDECFSEIIMNSNMSSREFDTGDGVGDDDNDDIVDDSSTPSSAKPRNQQQQMQQQVEIRDNLLGIFVVSFDARLGNVIEWQLPASMDLKNVEFKAMASGFHLMPTDIVYFRKDDMFGLAAFESIRIDSSEERNVRMKSVGLLAQSFEFLKSYESFLKYQVKCLLEQPGQYETLTELWHHKRIAATAAAPDRSPTTTNQQQQQQHQQQHSTESSFIDRIFSKRSTNYKHHDGISGGGKIYSSFVHSIGPSLFTLWKCCLLNKRILFYSTPPISSLCSRVYCTFEMTHTSIEPISKKQTLRPYFYVNVADIDVLQQESFFVACTTEKILQTKHFLYDLYVDVDSVHLSPALADSHKNLLKINSFDKKRYEQLGKLLKSLPLIKQQQQQPPQLPVSSGSHHQAETTNEAELQQEAEEEEAFIKYFTHLNDRLFSKLYELERDDSDYAGGKSDCFNMRSSNKAVAAATAANDLRHLSSDQIRQLGFDPTDDRDFLSELIHFYDFNLRV